MSDSNITISQQTLRRLLRKSSEGFLSEDLIETQLKTGKKKAKAVLQYLDDQGYIESTAIDGYWSLSIRGRLFCLNRVERIYKVQTLKDHIQALLERAAYVNSSAEYPDCITCLKILSPYPIAQSDTSIQIVFSLSRKNLSQKAYDKAADRLRKRHSGSIRDLIHYYGFPKKAIENHLKFRSPVFKLEYYDLQTIQLLEGVVIFEHTMKKNEINPDDSSREPL